MATVLVIDDNPDVGKALSMLFELNGIDTRFAELPDEGLEIIKQGAVDLVIQDMNFREDTTSGREGVRLFKNIRELDDHIPIILLTAWTDVEIAVDLMKSGAADYYGKPWDDHKLLLSVQNLLELRNLKDENQALKRRHASRREKLSAEFDLCGTLYQSDAMHEVLTLATQVAHADVPVLITGPNGCGKDKIAQVIQSNSSVADGPFVTVNMGALPKDLMEAELFGAVAGAFTGAQKKRVGRFETANGGTIFLDEIGNLSLEGQMKLLRVLQTGEYERLGSSDTLSTNVRVISATNTNLHEAIEEKTFREDLLYRLNVIEVRVPSLAERREDVLPLAQHFAGEEHQLGACAKKLLAAYHWPGNVRELQNVISRAKLLSKDKSITAELLGLSVDESKAPQTECAVEPDKALVEQTLASVDGNISQAAKKLGMSRQSFYRRMDKFGLK